MISRRPEPRLNRGRIATVAAVSGPPPEPPAILGALAWRFRADIGITIATGVSAWNDPVSGLTLDQGTGAAQPAFVASAINSRPAVQSDGVDDVLSVAWARGTPAALGGLYYWAVFRQVASNFKYVFGDFVAGGSIVTQTTSPSLLMFNTANANSNNGAPVGTYVRGEWQFTNSVADYQKLGATSVTGASAGNAAGGGTLQLFNRGDSAAGAFSRIAFAEIFAFAGTPSAGQRAQLDAYCTSLYGAGLV